jgi:hypothetical protein
MSDAMYWTFGFLAFFLLLILVTRIPGRNHAAAAAALNPRVTKAQEATAEELRSIGNQLGDIQQRLDSMERILKEVE